MDRRRRFGIVMAVVALVGAGVGIQPATTAPAGAAVAAQASHVHFGARIPIVLDPTSRPPTKVLPPQLRASSALAASSIPATIDVTYTGFSAPAQTAFQYAVDLWKGWVSSPVVIKVAATWTPLGQGVLGSAGPDSLAANMPGLPAGSWYPVALANAITGVDQDPANPDIDANFSSAEPDWYFGTDGNPGPGQIDFVSVVLHELGHGLGFYGLADVQSGLGTWGNGGLPGIYDRFTTSGSTAVTSFANGSVALASALQGKVVRFTGPAAVAAGGGTGPRLYAPAGWQEGSSYSHLDEATYPAGNPNSLMTPAIGADETIHDPGPLTRAMFTDMGWPSIPSIPPPPTGVTAQAWDHSAKVGFTIPSGSAGATFTATSSPDGISASGVTSPVFVPGLVPGISYTFTVTASIAAGSSAPSAPSNAVVPYAVPQDLPTIMAPVDGASAQSDVTIQASSADPAVWFEVDRALLTPPVPVTAGIATWTWSSIGVANGTHEIRAHSCATLSPDSCAHQAVSVNVNISNPVPELTSPANGQVVTGSMSMTATAESGAVGFFVDGLRVGFAATAPYEATVPVTGLTNGNHSATARFCAADGASCAGADSAPATFQVNNLLPTIPSVVGSPFNPNGDGFRDSVTVHYTLPDREAATWKVLNGSGAVIRGPISLGTLTAGSRTFVWNGKDAHAQAVSSGKYKIVIETTASTNGVTRYGSASRTVTVDRSAPQLTSIVGKGATFYPAGGGTPTSFTPKVTLSEAATLTLAVRTGAGALVRTVSAARPVGMANITWDGKSSAGAAVTSATYKWSLTAKDAAGNARTVGDYTAKLVRFAKRTTSITVNGNTRYEVLTSNPGCTGYSLQDSHYAAGLWLVDQCSSAFEIIQADYVVTVPAAYRYDSVTVKANGDSAAPPSEIFGGVHTATGWNLSGLGTATGANAWYSLGNFTGAGFVDANRQIHFTVGVDNQLGVPSDFDVNVAAITLHYSVKI